MYYSDADTWVTAGGLYVCKASMGSPWSRKQRLSTHQLEPSLSIVKRSSQYMVWIFPLLQAYGRTTVQGSPFRVRCQPPRADPENSSVTLMQEHAFIDDTVKASIRTVDQFGEMCSADGSLVTQILDAQTEKVLFDAHLVETGMVRIQHGICIACRTKHTTLSAVHACLRCLCCYALIRHVEGQ